MGRWSNGGLGYFLPSSKARRDGELRVECGQRSHDVDLLTDVVASLPWQPMSFKCQPCFYWRARAGLQGRREEPCRIRSGKARILRTFAAKH